MTGIRTRLTVAFGVGALLLSVTLASLTYELARNYLLAQRGTSSVHEASANMRLVRSSLAGGQLDVPSVLATLATTAGSESLVQQAGNWYSTSLAVGSQSLPAALRHQADLDRAATQRFRLAGVPSLAVELPMPADNAVYFEVFSLAELNRTLQALLTFLIIGAVITTVAGAAAGRWASRRLLVPLSDIAAVAVEIAGGALDARLAEGHDKDLRALAASFNHMVEALKTRVERDARLASDVSHELRSPLTTIAASLEVLLARRDELSPIGQEALDLLASDLQHFERLVEDLLEISRFDAGVVEPELEPIRLDELIGHTLDRAGVSRQVLKVETDAAGLTVYADKRRVERVVANLIDNAARHGGGVDEIGIRRDDGHVRVCVDDRGPGVRADLRERVFERFFRGPQAGGREGGGVGLGLALVAEQVRSQHGRAWVEDRPGGGARFVLELPAVPE
jgi:two-component system sensor histidine kinase MtrB